MTGLAKHLSLPNSMIVLDKIRFMTGVTDKTRKEPRRGEHTVIAGVAALLFSSVTPVIAGLGLGEDDACTPLPLRLPVRYKGPGLL